MKFMLTQRCHLTICLVGLMNNLIKKTALLEMLDKCISILDIIDKSIFSHPNII